jgi:UDP-glucuronate 4-epimerase
MKMLVTGAAGFIGYHVAERLLDAGECVSGIDSLNDYYDPELKRARLARLIRHKNFQFVRLNICNRAGVAELFELEAPEVVVHLAAQPGVRYSIENPYACADANLTGFLNVLEGSRRARVRHLIYASSSSVYGANTRAPFRVDGRADTPISLYAATKRANELMAHCYSHLFDIASTGLRFFTVYGPWARPDMAPSRFAGAILKGEPVEIYGDGRMERDFTYIDDVVECVERVVFQDPGGYRPVNSRLFNIGNQTPVSLMDFVAVLERALGKPARKKFLPPQPGDVPSTWADVEDFRAVYGFAPHTPLEIGLGHFAGWYREYYGAKAAKHSAVLASC